MRATGQIEVRSGKFAAPAVSADHHLTSTSDGLPTLPPCATDHPVGGPLSLQGSYYYAANPGREASTPQAALRQVQSDAARASLPLRYLQLDDWWFEQGRNGDFGGLVDWRPNPQLLPDGFGWLSTPAVLYMAMISSNVSYSRQNGGEYHFLSDGESSPPLRDPPRSPRLLRQFFVRRPVCTASGATLLR